MRLGALEALAAIASLTLTKDGNGSYVDLDGGRTEPGGLEGLAEHPAHGVAEEHDLVGEQRLVVLDAGVVDAGHVGGGEHPHDTGHA